MSTSRYTQDIDLADLNDSHTLAILSVPPTSRVLDIGAADGSVARALVERGCTVSAVEIDPAAAHEAEQHCQRVVTADVEELDLEHAFDGVEFDAVLLLDVLEHLRDPLAVLRSVAAVVGEDGRLIISIPNVAHAAVRLALLSGRFQYTDLGLLDRTHLRFFDKPAVDQLLADADLVVQEELHVTRGPTETEIPIDPSTFPPGVVAEATRDPESEIYQFVIVAAPRGRGSDDASSLTSALQHRVKELEAVIRESEAELELAVRRHDAELSASQREVSMLHQDLQLKERYLAKLREELAGREEFRTELATLATMRASLSWRVTAPLRSLQRLVRRHRSGLDS